MIEISIPTMKRNRVITVTSQPKRRRGQETQWKCADCGSFFASKQRLSSHRSSTSACVKTPVPDILRCVCGQVWPDRGDPYQVARWRAHMISREKHGGVCLKYIKCPLCELNLNVEFKAEGYVCQICAQESQRIHAKRGRIHPVLLQPFAAQSYEERSNSFRMLFAGPRVQQPALTRAYTLCPEANDVNRRALQAFAAFQDGVPEEHIKQPISLASDQPCPHSRLEVQAAQAGWDHSLDSERRRLIEYQRNAAPFCVHSGVWEVIQNHASMCSKRPMLTRFSHEASQAPMLQERADVLYWLYLSPQAKSWEVMPRPEVAPSQAVIDQHNLLQDNPRQSYRTDPMSLRAEILQLTTDDQWNNSLRWKALSPLMGIEPQLKFRAQTELERKSLDAFLASKVIATPERARLPYPENTYSTAMVLHPLLSCSGPVRIISFESERRAPLIDPYEKMDERARNLFYFIMRYVALHKAPAGQGNVARFIDNNLVATAKRKKFKRKVASQS